MTQPAPSDEEATRPARRWHPSLRQQLIGLIVLFAILAGAGALYQRSTSVSDAVDRAQQALKFRAGLAARAMHDHLTAVEAQVHTEVQFFRSAGRLRGCQVHWTLKQPFRGHTDVVGPDGTVFCSTLESHPGRYPAGAWLTGGLAGQHLAGPVSDPALHKPAIAVSEPVGNLGLVVTFLDMNGALPRLVQHLNGPVTAQFSLVTYSGQVLSSTAPQAQGGSTIDASVPVSSLNMRMQASTSRSSAIATAISLNNRLLWYLLIAFLVLLVAVQLVYAGMARPIQRLSSAVRRIAPGEVSPALSVSGPAEVVALGDAFATMTRTVRDELEARQRAQAVHAAAAQERDAQAAMLDLVVQSSPALIYVKDLEGRYVVANVAFERAVGLSEKQVVGHTDRELDPRLYRLWHDNDVRAREGRIEVEETVEGPRGTRYFEGVKFPLHDAAGTLYGVCGVSLDVTERRNAIVATAEARDAALAANAAKSAFLATMSHEIRTPMNAVIGMTELLEQTPLDPQQQEFVGTVRSSGEALMDVINNILDFSKIESGEMDLEMAPFTFPGELETCLDLVSRQAADKGLDLYFSASPDCPTRVCGDVVRLRQILTNLLANAVKFTEQGQVMVEVGCDALEQDAQVFRMTVTDTGIGISPEGRERLFKSFSQLDASTTRVYGGTGLGLAISKRLAEAMGGGISVSDNPAGRGTRFTATVKLGSCDDSGYAGGPDVTAPVLAGRSVLVVDNNETNQHILELQLTRLGMRCTVVSSPEEALNAVRGGLRYDVAILDMKMPAMDGLDLGDSLKQLAGPSAGSPLLLLTSIGRRPDGVEGSFAAILTKPVKSTSLRDALTQALSERPQKEAADESAAPATPSRRVLLAEDNAVNQRVVRLMLNSLGHSVDVVPDGLTAVEAVVENDYDVVLMDVQMPRMDGLEATRRIRAEVPHGRQPHIVALTASALVEDREACAAAGMEAYLTKPIRKRELQTMLDRMTPLTPAARG